MRLFAQSTPSARQVDLALAILRVAAGIIFVAHGAQKFFAFGIDGVTASFAGMGIPGAQVAAPAIATLEFVGGFALVLGLFTRPLALLYIGDMLGAITFVHRKGGFFVPGGVEFVGLLAITMLALALIGPGRFSLDSRLSSTRK